MSLSLCINPCVLVSLGELVRIHLSVGVSLMYVLPFVMSSSKEVSVKRSQVPGGGVTLH